MLRCPQTFGHIVLNLKVKVCVKEVHSFNALVYVGGNNKPRGIKVNYRASIFLASMFSKILGKEDHKDIKGRRGP